MNEKSALKSSQKVSPEVPLSEYKSKDSSLQASKKALRSTTVNSTTSIYGCGSSLSGSYGISGYYSYPSYSIDVSSTPYAAHVTISVGSYDVPNRFTVYDANNNVVASSGWMGYATYSGPWGMSLNSPETKDLVFDRITSTYTLKVETSVNGTSDSWYADVSCASTEYVDDLTNQEIIDIYSNMGTSHNQGLDYIFQELQNYYGSTYNGGNSQADFNSMINKTDSFRNNYLLTQLSASSNYVAASDSNFQSAPRSSLGSDLTVDVSYSPFYSSLSSQFKSSVSQLNSVINDSSRCYTKASYDSVINNNISLLPNNWEKIYLVSMSSIGYSSHIYWRDNSLKWESFFRYSVTDPVGKDIATSDMAGIVIGGTYGCYTGATGGSVVVPVIGTLTGCAACGAVGAITGGLGASAYTGVKRFFSWLAS